MQHNGLFSSSVTCRLSHDPGSLRNFFVYGMCIRNGYGTELCEQPFGTETVQQTNHQFSASAVELEFLRSERRLRSGRHFA